MPNSKAVQLPETLDVQVALREILYLQLGMCRGLALVVAQTDPVMASQLVTDFFDCLSSLCGEKEVSEAFKETLEERDRQIMTLVESGLTFEQASTIVNTEEGDN